MSQDIYRSVVGSCGHGNEQERRLAKRPNICSKELVGTVCNYFISPVSMLSVF
jgi:hypothetical protein